MRYFICCIILICYASPVFANIGNEKKILVAETSALSVVSGISSALSQADVALCKSMINPTHLRGEYGETILGKFYLEKHLQKTGSWRNVSARFGRQGIDQIYIKYDSLGRPRDIMVSEVKYGSSRLNTTKDGIQIGKRWTQKRLVALGNRYINAASSTKIQIQSRPSKLTVRHQIELDIGKGEKVYFWRENGRKPWKFEGQQKELRVAQKKAFATGKYIKKAGENIIRVRRRIIEVKPAKDFLKIIIKDAKKLDSGFSQATIKGQTFRIPLTGASGNTSNKVLSKEFAREIKKKNPHLTDIECNRLAKRTVKEINNVENIKTQQYSSVKYVLHNSFKAGTAGALISGAFEGISQAIEGRFDGKRLLENTTLGFTATFAGSAAGQATNMLMLRSKVAHTALTKTASSLGINTTVLKSTIGGAVSGGVSAVLFSYGGYLLGYHDSYTANKLAVSGIIGAGGGAVASSGTMALASIYGTAGTGTAIESLSGVAASNASLAWLGGGTVASGGGGVSLGAFVASGVVIAAITGTTMAVMYGCNLYEKKEDDKMEKLLLDDYTKGFVFRSQTERLFPFKP